MAYRRNSAVRISELGDFGHNTTNRRSRVDAPARSFIPRPSDRVSGVQPLEVAGGAGFAVPPRHRSADTGRHTQHHVRPRAESAQRPSSQSRQRSTHVMPRETPSQSRTPLARALLQTPMSAALRQSQPRTPSSEKGRNRLLMLEKATLALPCRDRRVTSEIIWQKRTSEYVVQYLLSHPVASSLMPNVSAPLRPVTIKLFLDLVNCLIGIPNHLNNTNYIEKLPLTAKRLLYPGVMSKSWLKSVNAMHTYPNMLAFLSFLVDYSKIRDSLVEKMTIEWLCGVEKHGQLVLLQQNFNFQCWDIFQDQADPDYSLLLNEYMEAYKNYYEVSSENIQALKEKKAELLRILNDPNVIKAKNREAVLRDEQLSIEGNTRQLAHTRSDLEKRLKQTINQVNQTRVTVDTAKDHVRNYELEIKELHKCIEEQDMSVRQRDEIKAKTERILTAADNKKELVKEMQKMSFNRGLELNKLQKQALYDSNNMNKILVAVGLAAGVNLNEYTLEERELLAGNTLEGTRTTLNEKLISIKKQGEERLQAARNYRESGVRRKQQVLIQLDSERQRLKTLQDELNTLEERSAQRKSACVEKLTKQRNTAQAGRQRVAERRRRTTQMFAEGGRDFEFWHQQNEKWVQKIEQLRSEEELVRKTCESRAKLLIGQYINLAKSIKD